MHRIFQTVGWLLLGVISALADSHEPGPDSPRELPCRVVDENGSPVRDAPVRLGGLERGAPCFDLNEDQINHEPGWKFTTDDDGRFTAHFGRFHPYQHLDAKAYVGPGYGEFHFVVAKAGFAGAVSREILNPSPEKLADLAAGGFRVGQWSSDDENEEWRHGEFSTLVLRDDLPVKKPLEIVLKRGLALSGRVLDPAGRPVRGVFVGLSLDLHHHSHTGVGGTIFRQGATTDRTGRFRLSHVYPNVFSVDVSHDSPAGQEIPLYWIRTRVRDHWEDKIVDEITPRRGDARQPFDYEKFIDLRIVVSRRPLYRYFGRVTDMDGHPAAGIPVIVRSVLHDPPQGWGETHGTGQTTLTDAGGNYSLRVGSRFVDGIWANEGDRHGGVETDELHPMLTPGRHDFAVRVKKLGE